MTTVLEAMQKRALAEFDRLVEQQEASIRAELAAAGKTTFEIEYQIGACLPDLAAQRLQVGQMVENQLRKSGIPLDTRFEQ